MSPDPDAFDHEAASFDQRAGLPDQAARRAAEAILTWSQAGPHDWLVEIGAGTGHIALHLVGRVRYLALDLSRAMLRKLRERCPPATAAREADAARPWPILDDSARIVFGSRSFHRLNSEILTREAFRVMDPRGGWLLEGHVQRLESSVKSRLRRKMLELIRREGRTPISRQNAYLELVQAACRRGANVIEPVTLSTWPVSTAPEDCLNSWRGKRGLTGIDLPAQTRKQILDELRQWAGREFGDLRRRHDSAESYVLQGVRLPGAA